VVDPFALGVLIVVALVILAACLSARASRRRPLAEFGRRAHQRETADRASLEHDDQAQMLEAVNARRRARGLPERSAAELIREFEGD
jgi:hypothetical protein